MNTPPTPDEDVEELAHIDEELGLAPDSARLTAEDQATRGPRKPSSDAVEQERIERARAEDSR